MNYQALRGLRVGSIGERCRRRRRKRRERRERRERRGVGKVCYPLQKMQNRLMLLLLVLLQQGRRQWQYRSPSEAFRAYIRVFSLVFSSYMLVLRQVRTYM
jgi:hypothetical protein